MAFYDPARRCKRDLACTADGQPDAGNDDRGKNGFTVSPGARFGWNRGDAQVVQQAWRAGRLVERVAHAFGIRLSLATSYRSTRSDEASDHLRESWTQSGTTDASPVGTPSSV